MPGCGSGVVVLPWSSPRLQHHAAVARKIHLPQLFRFPEPPLAFNPKRAPITVRSLVEFFRMFDFCSVQPNATDVEVLGWPRTKSVLIQCLASCLLKRRSHQVQRISVLRDRFRAFWRGGQCSAPPAQPSKSTEKSGRSWIGRTLSRGQVAEPKGFEPSRRFPVCTLSRGVPSTTRPQLRLPV